MLVASALGAMTNPVALGPMAQAKPVTLPVRLPLDEFCKDGNRLQQLRLAFELLARLTPHDVRSLFMQGVRHSGLDIFIDLSGDAEARKSFPLCEPLLAIYLRDRSEIDKLWPDFSSQDKCKHTQNDFLVWHRASLYYFERILRWCVQDESLALPYWDFVSNPSIPEAFSVQFLADGGLNYLFAPGREAELNLEGELIVPAIRRYFHDGDGSNSAGFGDLALEDHPHNAVHEAIGGWFKERPLAAFDPLFWVMHANVDRLFAAWQSNKLHYWAPGDFTEHRWKVWLAQPVGIFFDECGFRCAPSRDFFLKRANLGYRYDTDDLQLLDWVPPLHYPGGGIHPKISRSRKFSRLPESNDWRSTAGLSVEWSTATPMVLDPFNGDSYRGESTPLGPLVDKAIEYVARLTISGCRRSNFAAGSFDIEISLDAEGQRHRYLSPTSLSMMNVPSELVKDGVDSYVFWFALTDWGQPKAVEGVTITLAPKRGGRREGSKLHIGRMDLQFGALILV